MAARRSGNDDTNSQSSGASSQPLVEETTTANTISHRFTTSTPTLEQILNPPSLPFSSTKYLPHIPFDLISKILLKLPVKSLLRFRCVCKSWNALISDPKFAKDQSLCASAMDPTNLIVSFKNQSGELLLRDFSLSSVFNGDIASSSQRNFPNREEQSFQILAGPCHGMLLICIAEDRNCPILWNPATGKFKHLPSLRTWRDSIHLFYGLGYDHSNDSYKVVALVNARYAHVKAHTLGTDLWRDIGASVTLVGGVPNTVKFVSGTLNWLAFDENSHSRCIGSLDLVMETYRCVQSPGCPVDLAILKGCLCTLVHPSPHDVCNMVWEVWLLKDYGMKESWPWTKLFSFPLDIEIPKYDRFTTTVLCMSDDDDEILLDLEEELVVFNSNSDTYRTTGIQSFGGRIVAGVYVESLISP